MSRRQGQQSRVFDELAALIFNILRSPPTLIQVSDHNPAMRRTTAVSSSGRPPTMPPITPAGFASLLLGISVALMLGGSVTFFIGFMLMPWVLGLVMVSSVVGFVSSCRCSDAQFCVTPCHRPRRGRRFQHGNLVKVFLDVVHSVH